ncbi:ABC transporter related protein [Methanosalsum zhilinae DSM 4017]|uniref:Molybdate/tungstate import ATP-binding protein WtpC n=1 Tax=Methanosalsum zhilinae (strain DSM 4017 / NBRC 107636 / OCM 62 / WeN5) TaxID=679901 RepID=F7XNW5_METZD|nr:ABC transporter ATP-binding protein [Methanosalsum zhilinae]AEH60155.1 ABC transporter related protein [Methanosalsum zhilinae DSM 4017]
MGMLEIKVSKVFEKDKDSTMALKDINLTVKDGEFVCLIGPSGCGKTTLLRLVAGLEPPTSGDIILDGKRIMGPDPKKGMVFQEYSLFPWRNVIRNVSFGLEMQGMAKDESEKIAEKYIRMVGLEQFKYSYPHELSGGMRQRVAIARALANNPKILLMDEPFGALDAQTRNELQIELLDVWKEENITILFVTHSVDEAVFLADRIAVMTSRPGEIKEIIDVDISRPRERTSPEANRIRNRILRLLEEERKSTKNE